MLLLITINLGAQNPIAFHLDNPYPFPQNPKTVSVNEPATLKDGLECNRLWSDDI